MPGFLSVAAPGKTASCHTISQENIRCRLKVGFVLVGFFVVVGFYCWFLLLFWFLYMFLNIHIKQYMSAFLVLGISAF